MAPDDADSIDAQELFKIAEQIRLYQENRKLSDNKLLEKFAGLGSTKTFRKILKKDFKEVDIEAQLTKYNAVLTLIELMGGAAEERETLYADLNPALQLRSAFLDVMKENGDARFVLVLGDSGAGKTSSRRLLIESFGQRILWVEALEIWADSPMAFLGAVLRATGVKNPPYNTVVRQQNVEEHLKMGRVCLIVDEGHHLGPRCLNTIKGLLNNTPGEFVVLALYSLWKRLEREAYEEVKQLTGNRLAIRIQLRLQASDVLKMLQRRLTWIDHDAEKPAEASKAVALLTEKAPRYGNLAFVREVCKQAAEMASGDPMDLKLFSAALSAKEGSR